MNRDVVFKIVAFFSYILLQVLFFNKMVLFGKGFAFIYLGFLLTFQFELGIILAMVIGFATGITVDIFSNTLGIHASASVLLMYLRPALFNLFTPHGGYPVGAKPTPTIMGFNWFSTYSLILIFCHHSVLFIVEAGGFHLIFYTLQKIILSTFFTFSTIIIIQYLFSKKSRSR